MLFEKSMMKVHLQMAKPTAGYICNLLKRSFADMRRKRHPKRAVLQRCSFAPGNPKGVLDTPFENNKKTALFRTVFRLFKT